MPASHEDDILQAEQRGKIAKDKFVTERIKTHDKFFEPIKKMNLRTMEDIGKKVKLKSSKNKEIQYRQQGNVAMQLLVQSQNPEINIDLAEILKYPLTPVPFSIGTADGSLAKTDKSKGFKYLTEGLDITAAPATDKTVIMIEDGNALFHSMKEIPSNFKQISEKLFNMIPKKADAIFSTDMYLEDSVKRMERQRRGSSERLLITGENTKKPADWKTFLKNDDNKKQLVQVMQKSWNSDIYAKRLEGREVILICEGDAYLYTSSNGTATEVREMRELNSSQEETDTRVVLYIIYAKNKGYKTVQVRTPDSDIFFIILHYMDMFEGVTVLFDTGSGNNRRIFNMTELSSDYTPEYRTALLGLHAFCGCDTTSAFKGKGHVGPLKTMEKKPRYVVTFAQLGNSWEVSDETMKSLEAFTCAMYGNNRCSSVDELRLCKMKESCEDKPTNALRNVDMSTLPPCKRCLIQHIRRVNYQVAIWQRAHEPHPTIPPPTENHGWTEKDGMLEPLWIQGDVLPTMLIDILEETIKTNEAEDDTFDFLNELFDD